MQSSAQLITADQRKYSPPLTDRVAIADEVKAAYTADFGHLRSPIKHVARLALASPRSVESWVNGTRLPSLEFFFRLLPHSPSLQALMRRMIGLESELSPDFQRELMALVQRHLR